MKGAPLLGETKAPRLDLRLGRGFGKKSWIGLEYRNVNTGADLGEITGGKVEIGGSMLWIAYRRNFGRSTIGKKGP